MARFNAGVKGDRGRFVVGESKFGFEGDDRVSQLCGRLVLLGSHRLLQLLAEPDQFVLPVTGIGGPCRQLAAMLCFAVDVLQKRKQFVFEFGVIVRTTESPLAAELTETDPAVGAGGLVEFLECLVTGELGVSGASVSSGVSEKSRYSW